MFQFYKRRIPVVLILILFVFSCTKAENSSRDVPTVTIRDNMNREIPVPRQASRIICSGAGALRYITYMQCGDNVIAVDDQEKKIQQFDARAYAFAHPEFMELPVFGEFRGLDNPELISALDPPPDLIFKTYPQMGYSPVELQEKTGIPVVVLDYGDLGNYRSAFFESLALIGRVMKKEQRAAGIRKFVEEKVVDLDKRTKDIGERKTCYIGGVAYMGPLGLLSTEPGYPPLLFLNTPNAAIGKENEEFSHMTVSKEKIVEWDPEIIFIDLGTFQSFSETNALHELKTDPAYQILRAVKEGNIYSVLPYNWYAANHGSTLANAYYIGKVLYPGRFADIDPVRKADEIYTFLLGKPVFTQINESFGNMVFRKLEL